MPRDADRPKPRIYRDMCLVLDVVRLARGGFLTPGHHAGKAKLLPPYDTSWEPSVAIRTVIVASEGSLHIDDSREETIPLRRAANGRGPSWWRLICKPCGRPVRRLYLPEAPAGIEPPWACRACWGLAYRDARPGESERANLRTLLRLRAELDELIRINRMGFKVDRVGRPDNRRRRGPGPVGRA